MTLKRVIFTLAIEIEDPIALRAHQMHLIHDPETDTDRPFIHTEQTDWNAVSQPVSEAIVDAVMKIPGVRYQSSGAVPWPANEDGSFPEVRLPSIPAPGSDE